MSALSTRVPSAQHRHGGGVPAAGGPAGRRNDAAGGVRETMDGSGELVVGAGR